MAKNGKRVWQEAWYVVGTSMIENPFLPRAALRITCLRSAVQSVSREYAWRFTRGSSIFSFLSCCFRVVKRGGERMRSRFLHLRGFWFLAIEFVNVCMYSVLYISVYKSGSLDEIARQTRDILLKSKTVADDGGFGLHIASPGLQSLSWRLAQIQPQNFQSMLSSFWSSSQKPTPRSKLALLVRNRQSYHKLQCILLPAPTSQPPT